MTKTKQNLQDAFAGESQANRKYLAYAKQAEKEGLPQVAKLFRATAEAETIHAHAHFKLLSGVNDTMSNLKDAIAGETHEFTKMYPGMIEDAKAEGEKAVERYFGFANAVEEVHAGLYQNALDKGGDLPEADYYVCSVCGHTHAGKPEDKCPVCGAAAKAYFKVD